MTDDLLARGRQLDAADPLAAFRDEFLVADPELIYLDGSSLGRLPKATRDRLRHAVDVEWGENLDRGWERWNALARETGDVLAGGALGAAPGEVTLSDSTGVNLFRLAAAACDTRLGRSVMVTDEDTSPANRYLLEGLAAGRGMAVRTVEADVNDGVSLDAVRPALHADVALVSLAHVAYRSGAIADMAGITAAAHSVGALVLWDLSLSAGAVPVRLRATDADLAVGDSDKHPCGGPGAPGFLYVHQRLQAELRPPIRTQAGEPLEVEQRREDLDRFSTGTPPMLGAHAALEGARLTTSAGIRAIAAKGTALGTYAIELFDAWLDACGLVLASPRDGLRRTSHVTLRHPQAWQLWQAWRSAGVTADFLPPDLLRIGLAPMYTRYVDVYEGFRRLREIVSAQTHEGFPAERVEDSQNAKDM